MQYKEGGTNLIPIRGAVILRDLLVDPLVPH